MIKIAANWEIGYMTPIMEANYWNLVMRDFEVSEWMMTPVSGIRHNERLRVNLLEFHDYESMLESCSELQRVFLEPRTKHYNPETIWLHEFTHPESCVYVFGSAHCNPTNNKRENDVIVSIKTIQDKGVLWSNQCLLLVLYDRMVKSWQ
jgi:hypothetical protein